MFAGEESWSHWQISDANPVLILTRTRVSPTDDNLPIEPYHALHPAVLFNRAAAGPCGLMRAAASVDVHTESPVDLFRILTLSSPSHLADCFPSEGRPYTVAFLVRIFGDACP